MRANVFLGLFLGLILGFTVGLTPLANAARSAGGTYSLPTGNPVVSGTTITSTWANNTLGDISTELTNSLDRNGRGAMVAPLQCVDGTVSAPGVAFSGDLNTGLYRIGIDNPAIAAGGAKAQEWSTITATIPIGLVVTQDTSNASGITTTGTGTGTGLSATGGATNAPGVTATGGAGGNGVTATGVGVGSGISATGGATNGSGVLGTGAGTGFGVQGTGGASGGVGVRGNGAGTNAAGVVGVGGSAGTGVQGTGGAINGLGVVGVGAGTGAGGSFSNGTAATAATRQAAVSLGNGDLDLAGVANPSSTTAIASRLTPMGLIKAWGRLSGVAATVASGANIDSTSCATNLYRVTFAAPMADTSYLVLCSTAGGSGTTALCSGINHGTSAFEIEARSNTGSQVNLCAGADGVNFLVLGAQ